MNPQRMTIEELKQLNPSMENPIELVCDDGHFRDIMANIKVIAVVGNRAAYIGTDGELRSIVGLDLKHYPSPKKEPRNFGFLHINTESGNLAVYNEKMLHTNFWRPVTIKENGEIVEVVE